MSKTTLYLPLELQHRLRHEARRSGRSQADLVRDALTAYLSARKRPLPASIGIADDGTLDASTVKDWIRATWHEDHT